MKNILITGVSRGIGQALAKKFLDSGDFVIGTSISGQVSLEHNNLVFFPLDITKNDNVVELIDRVHELDKKIDILINNAGALFDENEDRVVIDKLRQTLEVNLIGTINFTEQILPLIKKPGGQIINMSSTAGSLALSLQPYYPSYKISKCALNMYTRTLASRLADEITVSSVHPGWVKTEMGGEDAEISPEEAAEYIYNLAIKPKESGNFWHKSEAMPW